MTQAHLNPKNRLAALVLFDATMSNPNGDPDNGNAPRADLEGYGIVSAPCIKRKIRDYIATEHGGKDGYNIFIQNDDYLNTKIDNAAAGYNLKTLEGRLEARQAIIDTYVDVRLFGAVISTGDSGKLIHKNVKGPFVVSHALSVSPVEPVTMTITRQAVTANQKGKETKEAEMGNLTVVRYGLYAAKVFYTPSPSHDVSEEDMEVFWEAVSNLFTYDKSAARPDMCVRKIVIFARTKGEHGEVAKVSDSDLFNRVSIRPTNPDMISALSYQDYEVSVDLIDLPAQVEVVTL